MEKERHLRPILEEKGYKYIGAVNGFDNYKKKIKGLTIVVNHMPRVKHLSIKCVYAMHRELSTGFFKDTTDVRQIEGEFVKSILEITENKKSKLED